MINRRKAQLLISVLLAFYAMPGLAVNCDEPSPNLAHEGDMYYDVTGAGPLTKIQEVRVKRLLKSIQGRWQGTGVKSHCVESRKKIYQYKLKANAEQKSDGKLIFEVNSLDTQSKTMRDETFRFLGANNQYHITKLTEDSLGLYVKYRRPNATRKNTIFIEEIVEISGNKKALKFNITQYLNGYFSEEFHRTFHR